MAISASLFQDSPMILGETGGSTTRQEFASEAGLDAL